MKPTRAARGTKEYPLREPTAGSPTSIAASEYWVAFATAASLLVGIAQLFDYLINGRGTLIASAVLLMTLVAMIVIIAAAHRHRKVVTDRDRTSTKQRLASILVIGVMATSSLTAVSMMTHGTAGQHPSSNSSDISPRELVSHTGCIPPGDGYYEYSRAFRDAYDRAGGISILGCGLNSVTLLDGGYHQNFEHAGHPGVIFAYSPDRAYALDPDYWYGYHHIYGPVRSLDVQGFPYDEGHTLSQGKFMELGAGGNGRWARSGIVKHGEEWYLVPDPIWTKYMQVGGPDGGYGYPSSEAIDIPGGIKQEFENEVLYSVGGRALTHREYDTLKH